MSALKIKQPIKGVFQLDVIGEDLADYSQVDISDPLKQLNANIDACKFLEQFREDSEIFQKRSSYTVEDDLQLFNDRLVPLMKKNPLMLLNECVSRICPLTRSKTPHVRGLIELIANGIISTTTAFVGSGGMFQEMYILTDSKCKYVYMIDDLRDYIETITETPDEFIVGQEASRVVDPLKYYGKKDASQYARARWAMVKTYRYISFINWFKQRDQDIKLIVCDSEDSYAEAIERFPKPGAVIAIDIIDDFAESSLKTYYSCALSTTGATCLNASSGLIHLFKVNHSPLNIKYSSFDYIMKRISTDTTTIVNYSSDNLGKYSLMLGVAKWKVSDTKTKLAAVYVASLFGVAIGVLVYGLTKLL